MANDCYLTLGAWTSMPRSYKVFFFLSRHSKYSGWSTTPCFLRAFSPFLVRVCYQLNSIAVKSEVVINTRKDTWKILISYHNIRQWWSYCCTSWWQIRTYDINLRCRESCQVWATNDYDECFYRFGIELQLLLRSQTKCGSAEGSKTCTRVYLTARSLAVALDRDVIVAVKNDVLPWQN